MADWTEAEDAKLTRLATGTPRMYYADIGAAMGKTKGSIIGRAHRLGLPARTTGPHGGRPKRIGPPPIRIRFYVPKNRKPLPPVPASETTIQSSLKPLPLELFDLELSHCRWPCDCNNTFCADEVVPGKSYCAWHCQVAYRRAAEISEKAQARMSRYGNWSARTVE